MLRTSEVRAVMPAGAASPPVTRGGVVTRAPRAGVAWVRLDGAPGETPCSVGVACAPGDRVSVTVEGHAARVTSNETRPATDDSVASSALAVGEGAAADAASAVASSEAARAAATDAQSASRTARDMARAATASAAEAAGAADEARGMAADAAAEAARAQGSADAAQGSADDAARRAESAGASAAGALRSLSTVQDVLGTLSWIRAHGTYARTPDTAVDAEKAYYARVGDAAPWSWRQVEPDGTEDPSEEGWWELSVDQTLAAYTQQHLALTSEGLSVVALEGGYRVLVSPTGMYVIDPRGDVVGRHGEGMQLGSLAGTHMEAEGDRLSFFMAGFSLPRAVESEDASVVSGKTYYERSASGEFTPVTPDGTEDPSEEGWWEDSAWGSSTGEVNYYRSSTHDSGGKFDGEVAYIAIDENGESVFYMNRAVVVSELRFGLWMWTQRTNGNLTLKWRG